MLPTQAAPAAPSPCHTGKPRRPRLDWATALQRTFGIDVWTCHCGGRRTIRAIITDRAIAQTILDGMGLAGAPSPRRASQSPPQLALAM